MEQKIVYQGAISAFEEFFYPDTPLSDLPEQLCLSMAQNAHPGIQLLLKTTEKSLPLHLETENFTAEWFRMRKIPVEYNTGNGEDQGGAMVLEQRPAEKPTYATRLAPFQVYDCLQPIRGELLVEDDLAALYLCLIPKKGIAAGLHTAVLSVGGYSCRLKVQVYAVEIPEDTFPVTNWFSLKAIARQHHLPPNTPVFYAMLKQYAQAMRRLHQTMFYLELDDACVTSRDPYTFDFSYLEPVIACFFETGMKTLEIGPLLSRGYLPDGMPNMRTDQFTCAMAPDLPIDSPEGYAVTVRFVQSLATFLKEHGWEKEVIFHIHDEPDIHCPEEALLPRKEQYYLAANILRKYLPGVRVIEAVSSAEFRGGVDIWVPGTPGYEQHQAEFDRLIALGEEVWAYVCCGPEGHWLNRFLDFALLKGRLLFWGCAKNRLAGFLHWGFNQFPDDMNPFERTSCPNHTGIGTNFPCGDSFLVYPGTDGPWPGMRMEAARRGAEDAALLQILRKNDPKAHDALVNKVFRTNSDYDDNPAFFAQISEELLKLLAAE